MIIQKQDCKMDVDIEKTKEYYQSHSLCSCPCCRNFYAQAEKVLSRLSEFLSELGVDISRPEEMGSDTVEDKVDYFFVAYTVIGKILEHDKYEIDIQEGDLFLNIVIGDHYIPNEQKSDYFVVTVYGIKLPWVLDEVFPESELINDAIANRALSRYSEHHCVLIKKYRTLFHYVWLLDDGGKKLRVNVGKALYDEKQIGTKLTIGRIGRRLINIRVGFCKFSQI